MRFHVNVDHVATVRQARRTVEPDPVAAALLAERAGADGITVHLREDRRHIQDDDVVRLRAAVTTALNLELSLSAEIVAFAERLRPHQATLVPERREEITTEGGLDCARHATRIRDAVARLQAAGIRTSLFVTADALEAAAVLGADAVELHTGAFANAWPDAAAELAALAAAATRGRALGLSIHAGHGLNYGNVHAVTGLPEVEELNIGHAIVSRAVLTGMDEAVRAMRAMIDRARTAA